MALWVDKYRPKCLSKLDYHQKQADDLKKLADIGDFPHLLIFGPPGSGKKTRIMCMLRELYGPGVERLRIEKHTFTTPSNKKIELTALASNYHIEINPSDAGFNDRTVVQELVKTVAQTNQLDTTTQRRFKVIILTEVDKLSRDAQHALRRTMEKYMMTCRLILYCTSTSRVIPALRSRCLCIRVAAPTIGDTVSIIHQVCKKEGLNLPTELGNRIAKLSKRNLRRALLMCQTCWVHQQIFSPNQEIMEPDWEIYLRETANLIVSEQTPARLLEVRQRIYELLTRCIPPGLIMKGLYNELTKNCDSTLKTELSQIAATYEHNIHLGTKPVLHIEAFIAKFASSYKKFLEEGLDAMF